MDHQHLLAMLNLGDLFLRSSATSASRAEEISFGANSSSKVEQSIQSLSKFSCPHVSGIMTLPATSSLCLFNLSRPQSLSNTSRSPSPPPPSRCTAPWGGTELVAWSVPENARVWLVDPPEIIFVWLSILTISMVGSSSFLDFEKWEPSILLAMLQNWGRDKGRLAKIII